MTLTELPVGQRPSVTQRTYADGTQPAPGQLQGASHDQTARGTHSSGETNIDSQPQTRDVSPDSTSTSSQVLPDTHVVRAAGGPVLPADQGTCEIQRWIVGGIQLAPDHVESVAQIGTVRGTPTSDETKPAAVNAQRCPVSSDSASSNGHPGSDPQTFAAVAGLIVPTGHVRADAHARRAGGDTSSGIDRHHHEAHVDRVDAGSSSAPGGTKPHPVPSVCVSRPGGFLRDPLLGLLAEVVDDLETVRIANSNRVRILTRSEADTDGEERGFGLTPDNPEVAKLLATVEVLQAGEADAVKNLQNAMKKHPLGKFVQATPGLGLKQTARLLAAIGDPYWNDLHDRPRTVSELWAYCGFHVVQTSGSGQARAETHFGCAAAGSVSTPTPNDVAQTQGVAGVGVAPKRTRGQKSNWSETARKRTWVIASAIPKFKTSPYEPIYRAARAKYADTVHPVPCVRCGPSGKPAPAGSPRSAAHQNAMAIRIVAKEILKDLWIQSRNLYDGDAS